MEVFHHRRTGRLANLFVMQIRFKHGSEDSSRYFYNDVLGEFRRIYTSPVGHISVVPDLSLNIKCLLGEVGASSMVTTAVDNSVGESAWRFSRRSRISRLLCFYALGKILHYKGRV